MEKNLNGLVTNGDTPIWSKWDNAELDLKMNNLEQVCRNLDPFNEIPPETIETLKEFGLKIEELDPFGLTRTLLQLLDNLQLEREQRTGNHIQ